MNKMEKMEPLDCYDGAVEFEERDCEDNETYCLTEWGCLYSVLMDYGIDASNIPGRVGKHIVEDFMEAMCKLGYIKERKANEDSEH